MDTQIQYWAHMLDESHPPIDDFLNKNNTYGRNFRDILKKVFESYGEGYSADAFVAFSKEMAK